MATSFRNAGLNVCFAVTGKKIKRQEGPTVFGLSTRGFNKDDAGDALSKQSFHCVKVGPTLYCGEA